MTGPVFVDSNILVYRRDSAILDKQQQAERWIQLLWKRRAGRVSVQVLNEFYVTVTRKLSPGLSATRAQEEVRDLFAWKPVPLSVDVVEGAFSLEDRYGFSYWDSLILSAAQVSGCSIVLSEDLQDSQEMDRLTIVNPFLHGPELLDER